MKRLATFLGLTTKSTLEGPPYNPCYPEMEMNKFNRFAKRKIEFHSLERFSDIWQNYQEVALTN
jgi:hypothetical protein